MNDKLGQEPAFPNPFETWNETGNIICGTSKRFYAACAAMQGILSKVNIEYGKPNVNAYLMENAIRRRDNFMRDAINCSYRWADELLKQE